MKLIIDTEQHTLTRDEQGRLETIPLYSDTAFALLTREWLKIGWNQKYTYTFSWMGRPIIQLPEDLIRIQEVIYALKPSVVIETGVAHGGSLVYYASLLKAMSRGGSFRVIGVDVEIRKHNRRAIQDHELCPYICLVEGNSVAPEVIERVRANIRPEQRVLVILDSCHTKQHVRDELEAYHGFVTPGSYIVATDGIMRDLGDVPRGRPEWGRDNPTEAAAEFARDDPDFLLEDPRWPFNESSLRGNVVTHWPGAWLRRRTPAATMPNETLGNG
jgi:cephalosporin hydroxylase